MRHIARSVVVAVVASLWVSLAVAEDWPEMQGKGRTSQWNETGVLRKFPEGGLKFTWRVSVGGGFSGPAVAEGRVFVSDYVKDERGGDERVHCLNEQTGETLWMYENRKVSYQGFDYATGPRATPTVDGDRVFVLGAAGDLYCLGVADGKLLWHVNLPERCKARPPMWGFAPAPIVYGDRVICAVNGQGDSRLVALDRATGETLWHALPPAPDLGYSAPILVHAGGVDQLIHFHVGAVVSLNPQTGEVYWQQAFDGNLSVATPVVEGDKLFVSAFYSGPLMLKLAADKPAAEVLWKGTGTNEVNTSGIHALMGTPLFKDGYLYGTCSYGQFRCINATTGERVWETMDVTEEKVRWAAGMSVRNGDVFFINNDRGELIIADLSPAGYKELGRAQLIKPTTGGAGTRELKVVNWVYPAYANKCIVTRNDEEIVRASLAE